MLSTLSYVAGFSASKDYATLFLAFKHEHAKHYDSAAAEAQAFKAFSENEDIIASHNAKNLAYKLGHNEYSDLSKDDFWTLHFKPGFDAKKAKPAATSLHVTSNAALPDAVDWVTAGAVTPVKNQGRCGSCWAFSTTGSLEGAYQIASGTLLSLSEEDLVQCDTTDNGCSGGLMDNAFKWVEANGIAAESAYAYTSGGGTTGTCDTVKEGVPVVKNSGFTDVPTGDEDALKSAVAQQPVSVAIEADKSVFQLYASGVLDSTACGTQLDHGVLVVGYGTDMAAGGSGTDYWKVKNSWGATWGESGYIRMARGVNQCGIAMQPSYPTGVKAAATSAAALAAVIGTDCDSIGDKSTCDSSGCSWCTAGAVPDSCKTMDEARQLPPAVFDCDNLA